MDQEKENYLSLLMELRSFMSNNDFYDAVLSKFSDEDLINYRDKYFDKVIAKLKKEGKHDLVKELQARNKALEKTFLQKKRKDH